MTKPETRLEVARKRPRPLGLLGRALNREITRLQAEYLRDKAAAHADLARLRRGLAKPAGSMPEIWRLTVGAVPAELTWNRDEPSWAEQAAHAALTLYALHQQSVAVPMHLHGVSFGHAVSGLRFTDQRSEQAVTRRFMTVATAETINEVLTHARGLITQLRSERIGFDYARFADDLLGLLTPGRAQQVRLSWGRSFYHTTPDPLSDNGDQALGDATTPAPSDL